MSIKFIKKLKEKITRRNDTIGNIHRRVNKTGKKETHRGVTYYPTPQQVSCKRAKQVEIIEILRFLNSACNIDLEYHYVTSHALSAIQDFWSDENVVLIPHRLSDETGCRLLEKAIRNNSSWPVHQLGVCDRKRIELRTGEMRQLTVHLLLHDRDNVLFLRLRRHSGIYKKGTVTMVQGHVTPIQGMQCIGFCDILLESMCREFREEVTSTSPCDIDRIIRFLSDKENIKYMDIKVLPHNVVCDHIGIAFSVYIPESNLITDNLISAEPLKHDVEIVPLCDIPKVYADMDPLAVQTICDPEINKAFGSHVLSKLIDVIDNYEETFRN